jgi:hypothetical protein
MTQEVYQEPSEAEMRERAKRLDKEQADARAAQIEAAHAPTRNMNIEYAEKQRKFEEECAATNAKNKVAQEERDRQGAARRIAENKANMDCHATTNKPPEGFIDMAGTIPCKRNPSITLKPQPDPAYFEKKPQPGMADILANRPMSGVDQRNAELQRGPVLVRPTKPCPNCGSPVEPQTAWHRLSSGEACVLPGGEELARREGIVVTAKPVPTPK